MKKITHKNTPFQSDTDKEMRGVVLHSTLGTYEGTVAWLTNNVPDKHKRDKDNGTSSHFVVGRMGQTTQIVPQDKMAWHSGRVYEPNERAKKVLLKKDWDPRQYINPNKYLIGIEMTAGYDIDKDGVIESWEKGITQYQVKQVAGIINSLDFDVSPEWVLTHQDIASYKPDLDRARSLIVSELAAPAAPAPPKEKSLEIESGGRMKLSIEDGSILAQESKND